MNTPDRRVPPIFAELRADVLSGSTPIAREAAGLIATALNAGARTSAGFVEAATSVTLAVLDAQPAMASLVSLAREVLGALDPAAPLHVNRERLMFAAAKFAEDLEGRAATLAERAAAVVPSERPVLTLSASSAVEATLMEMAKTRRVHAVCLESRPMNEGRRVAAGLADAGVQVTLAVDAALESIILACGSVLLGADSIGDKGVVNKIGSAAAAHAARRNRIQVLVVADSSKLLPRGFPQLIRDDRPAEDVWPEHGPVHVWNRYFEVVPMSLITKVVTEEGAIMSESVDSRRVGLSMPPALAQWAASRL